MPSLTVARITANKQFVCGPGLEWDRGTGAGGGGWGVRWKGCEGGGRRGGLEMEVLGHANGSLTQDCNVAWASYDAFNI